MRKSFLLMPFIAVYKIVFGILKIPVLICKYFYRGVKVTLKFILNSILYICWCFYQIPKSIVKGISKLIPHSVSKKVSNSSEEFDLKEFERLRNFKKKTIKKIKTDYLLKNKNKKNETNVENTNQDDVIVSKQADEIYGNSKVKVKAPGLGEKIKELFAAIGRIPSKIKQKINNNEFVKHSRNKDMMKREALLINFEGEDAEKSDVKVLYEYVAKNPEGKIVKDYFEAFSKVEVHSFLLSEGYEVYSIRTNKWIQMFHKNANTNNIRFKTKDLPFFLTQLSTYIKAGIPLVEALKILEKQYKNKGYKKILKAIIYDLTMGENFSEALLKQNVAFPKLLINMVKTAEMTGELPEVLDDQAQYYSESLKIKRQMVTAMMYPSIVMIASIGVAVFIMMYVIPQFVEIYNSMDPSAIPKFTLIVLAISDFLRKYIVYILIGLVIFIVLFVYLYKTIKGFRTICQWVIMKTPFIGTTIIYNEVAMFTKTFASLLAHNVFITDSMEVLNRITKNEIYKMIILDTITNLAKGDKISEAFKDNWAFPVPAYEMLVTGEKTGELPEMMQKVADYYQQLHAESVTRIKTFVEPAITIFLTVIVGTLILAIIIPMFSMYSAVQSM